MQTVARTRVDDLTRAKAEYDSETAKARVDSRRVRHETREILCEVGKLLRGEVDAEISRQIDSLLDEL